MQQALLKPLLMGASMLEKVSKWRCMRDMHDCMCSVVVPPMRRYVTCDIHMSWHDVSCVMLQLFGERKKQEASSLEDLLIHTFLILQQIMRMQSTSHSVSVAAAIGKHAHSNNNNTQPSFHHAILESFTASAQHDASRNLLPAMVAFCAYARSADIQALAYETLTALASPVTTANGTSASAPSLAGYLGASVGFLRKSCIHSLTSRTVSVSVKHAVLHLLAITFEHQPGLADRFLKLSYVEQQTTVTADSILTPIKAYLADAQRLFDEEPGVLAHVLHLLFSLWEVAPGYQNVAAVLKQEPGFWQHLCHGLMLDVEDIQLDAQTTASTIRYVDQLAVRAWSLQILAVELYNSTGAMDAGLATQMQCFVDAQRYPQWMVQYTRCDEDVELQQLLETQAHAVGVDLRAYAAVGTSSRMASAR